MHYSPRHKQLMASYPCSYKETQEHTSRAKNPTHTAMHMTTFCIYQ